MWKLAAYVEVLDHKKANGGLMTVASSHPARCRMKGAVLTSQESILEGRLVALIF